jgi:hypothetical protein
MKDTVERKRERERRAKDRECRVWMRVLCCRQVGRYLTGEGLQATCSVAPEAAPAPAVRPLHGGTQQFWSHCPCAEKVDNERNDWVGRSQAPHCWRGRWQRSKWGTGWQPAASACTHTSITHMHVDPWIDTCVCTCFFPVSKKVEMVQHGSGCKPT